MERAAGVLIDKDIEALVAGGQICPAMTLVVGQIQPASMDLRLGTKAWRMKASQLPGKGHTVREAMEKLVLGEVDLTYPTLVERGAVLLVELAEEVALADDLCGTISPKSSTGRLDIFVRVVTDYGQTYDAVPAGYKGKLYLEVMPLTFGVTLRAGDRLTQLRLRPVGSAWLTSVELAAVHAETPLLYATDGDAHIGDDSIWISMDLRGDGSPECIVGYRAPRARQPQIDVTRVGGYDWRKYWEPIYAKDCDPLVINPEDFYIFASMERVSVPPGLAAELVAYDIRVGELRLHYAGFFDPGFGWSGGAKGTTAVLEVRAHDVPCVLHHGQRIGRFMYERLSGTPKALYGAEIGSNYAGQGLKLAKQFVMD